MLHGWAGLGWAEVETLSVGGPGFAGVGLKYFKSASEEKTGSTWSVH